MDSLTLRTVAACWLRYTIGCSIVTFERGPNHFDNPDVYGVNKSRHGLEVEVKVSLSDFKREAKKRKWDYQVVTPMFFYYLVPNDILEKVKPLIPPGVGLLTVSKFALDPYTHLPSIRCEVRPTRNPKARKLSPYCAARLVKHQSGTLCALAVAQVNLSRLTQSKESP